jgi:hypothetical protein
VAKKTGYPDVFVRGLGTDRMEIRWGLAGARMGLTKM